VLHPGFPEPMFLDVVVVIHAGIVWSTMTATAKSIISKKFSAWPNRLGKASLPFSKYLLRTGQFEFLYYTLFNPFRGRSFSYLFTPYLRFSNYYTFYSLLGSEQGLRGPSRPYRPANSGQGTPSARSGDVLANVCFGHRRCSERATTHATIVSATNIAPARFRR